MWLVTSTHFRRRYGTFERAVIAAHAVIVGNQADHAEVWSPNEQICRQYFWQNGEIRVAI